MTSRLPQMATFRTQQITPNIKRVWHDPSGSFVRPRDPALGDWGRSQVDACAHEEHETMDVATVLDDAGDVLTQALEFERDDDGNVRISFALAPGERIYGAYDSDATGLDRRGDHVHLVTELHPHAQHRTLNAGCDLCGLVAGEVLPDMHLHIGGHSSNYGELIIPFFISSRGYGIYISNLSSWGVLDFGATASDRTTFTAPGGHADIYLFGPAQVTELVQQFSRLTGHQPLPPAWALGFIQSRFGYESFDHALSVLERFDAEQLPVHGLVFDVQWLEDHVNLRWNPDGFQNPEENLARIAEHGPRVVVITEPGTREDASNFASGAAIDGAYAVHRDGSPYDSNQWYTKRGITGYRELTPSTGALVNFFKEEAADWWYQQHEHLLEMGVDAWWLDLNEPEDFEGDVVFRGTDWPAGAGDLDGADARNIFALAQQRAFARRDRQHTDRRPFVLSRAGSAGSQRYGAAPWSGDISATWQDMQRQVRLALTAGMCGIPMWGCDIGGFGGEPSPELFARWMQMGSFLPVMRAHGCMRDREPWSQGVEALEALRPSLVLRAQLLPSIVTWTYEALRDGLPLVRPMLFEDPQHPRWFDCHDQWMFGPLLVAPVLEEGATTRRIELPRGEWVDPWSGTVHQGPATIEVEVDMHTVPVFVPRNTLLLADPEPLNRRARNWPPAELEVWSFGGGDAERTATLYSDDGITRMHEQGAYCYQQLQLTGDELHTERVSGAWPSPRLRVAPPHPGQLIATTASSV